MNLVLLITTWILLPKGTPLWGICWCCVRVSKRKCCLFLPQMREERGLCYPFQRQGPLLPQEWPLSPQISGNNRVVGNMIELQVSQCLCQEIKPLWNQRGWAAEQLVKPRETGTWYSQQRKNWAVPWLYIMGYPFHILLFVAGSAQGWMVCYPTDFVQAAFSKIILNSLEAWGVSKLADTVLSSGLLPWSSHGSAQMSVLTCMCSPQKPSRSEDLDSGTPCCCVKTHRLACSSGITKTWSVALVGICPNSPQVIGKELMPLSVDHSVPKTLLVPLCPSSSQGTEGNVL